MEDSRLIRGAFAPSVYARDDAWVVGSAIVLELFWADLAPVARALTIAVALVVAVFAILQFRAAGWWGVRVRRLA